MVVAMGVDVGEHYEIAATASYILTGGFTRVALQFPDQLLQISVEVTSLLRSALCRGNDGINLYVMADTTYGSCCVDEIAAAHVDAQCIIHYGHACLSQTSRLPVFFVFGREQIDTHHCSEVIVAFNSRPLLVLFAFQYAHAVHSIRTEVLENITDDACKHQVVFAEVPSREMEPLVDRNGTSKNECAGKLKESPCCQKGGDGMQTLLDECNPCCSPISKVISSSAEDLKQERVASSQEAGSLIQYSTGGLKWFLPKDVKMDNYTIVWIGEEGAGLTNLMLTYNKHTIVRYDTQEKVLVKDLPSKSRDLMRRYYLVERAKEASIVGIVVGTLGVAGYNEAIQRVRDIVASAGKKSYTMVMGRPNPAKLANFPECDVFVLVACAQTILLDSKEYLTPLITPFEAELAFVEGREWTGAFNLEICQVPQPTKETLDTSIESGAENDDGRESNAIILSEEHEHALQLHSTSSLAVASSGRANMGARSSSEYLALRSYQGLEIHTSKVASSKVDSAEEDVVPASHEVVEGQTGRAAGYWNEAPNL